MIGLTDPVCPYCKQTLKKMPGRKTKCPACGESIFVRTRPQDKARILVREDQLLAVEEQWAIANGTHEQFLAERRRHDETTAALRQRFGKEPSKNDVQWAKLNDDMLTYIRDWDWGHYRNARFAMSELLVKEAKYSDALKFLMEVCYLDLNGPRNCGGNRDPAILRQFPPFDPTMGFLAPGVIKRVHKVMQQLGQSHADVKAQFLALANKFQKSLKLPVAPSTAWSKLTTALGTEQ